MSSYAGKSLAKRVSSRRRVSRSSDQASSRKRRDACAALDARLEARYFGGVFGFATCQMP